jgi:hypothetical protein
MLHPDVNDRVIMGISVDILEHSAESRCQASLNPTPI